MTYFYFQLQLQLSSIPLSRKIEVDRPKKRIGGALHTLHPPSLRKSNYGAGVSSREALVWMQVPASLVGCLSIEGMQSAWDRYWKNSDASFCLESASYSKLWGRERAWGSGYHTLHKLRLALNCRSQAPCSLWCQSRSCLTCHGLRGGLLTGFRLEASHRRIDQILRVLIWSFPQGFREIARNHRLRESSPNLSLQTGLESSLQIRRSQEMATDAKSCAGESRDQLCLFWLPGKCLKESWSKEKPLLISGILCPRARWSDHSWHHLQPHDQS